MWSFRDTKEQKVNVCLNLKKVTDKLKILLTKSYRINKTYRVFINNLCFTNLSTIWVNDVLYHPILDLNTTDHTNY